MTVRIVREIVLLAVGVVFSFQYFCGPTLFRYGRVRCDGARVCCFPECRFTGPVTDSLEPDSENITGLWWLCTGEVHWDDGAVERREFSYSPLRGDKTGRTMRVVEREFPDTGGPTYTRVHRASFGPAPVRGGAVAIFTGLAGGVTGGMAGDRLFRRIRGKSAKLPEA
ncbi:DUF6346 domain-containing protein [Halosaccharopolyspora lacisalsi]